MFKKVFHKLREKKELLQHGILPQNLFNEFYQNAKAKPEDYINPVMKNEEANEWLFNKIESGKPFLATRFGSFELGMVSNFLYNRLSGRNHWGTTSLKALSRDQSWQGNIEAQENFYHHFLRAIPDIDALGIWYNHGEQVMANYLCKHAVLFELLAFEPYFYQKPWTLALRHKKVLVIHPYTNSIPAQYKNRQQLFEQEVLPEFELITYRPFSSFGDEWKQYPDMQATLDKMIADIQKIDFDIALIACGPQGLPLGTAIKAMNKQAVHVGGALQLFFGILGKRWEEPGRPQSVFFNEHWVRPTDAEIPKDARALKFSDEGCYW